MGTINGLPAHVLLVHAVVVLLPLAAVLLAATVIRPGLRARLAGPNALLSVLVLALVPVTTEAGEWLEHRVTPTALLHRHTELGDGAIAAALPVAVLAVVVWWRHREATAPAGTARRAYLAPGSGALTRVIAVLAVAAALFAVYDIYRIGDSGAKASWNGTFSTTANPGSDGD